MLLFGSSSAHSDEMAWNTLLTSLRSAPKGGLGVKALTRRFTTKHGQSVAKEGRLNTG